MGKRVRLPYYAAGLLDSATMNLVDIARLVELLRREPLTLAGEVLVAKIGQRNAEARLDLSEIPVEREEGA